MNNDWKNLDELVLVSVREIGNKIADILPDFVGAGLVVVIGLFIAGSLGKLVTRLLRSTGVDSLLSESPLGKKVNVFPRQRIIPSQLVGWLVKWFFILVTLITATSILGWTQINEFLNQVVLYIPNVIIAVLILVVGFIASDFVRNIVTTLLERSPLSPSEQRFLGGAADFAVTLFAIMAALLQLKIAASLIQTLFTGIIFALSLAIGLAFGLGGREHAARFLSRYTERMAGQGTTSSSSGGANVM